MAEAALDAPSFEDVDSFLTWAEARDARFELVEGRIVAMAPPSERHVDVAANVVLALGGRLRGTPCRPRAEAPVVTPGRTRANARRPDATVVCRGADGAREVTVVVEVLSPGTEAEDRGAKLREYAALPSLRHYLLIAQDEVRVETFSRLTAGDQLVYAIVEGEGATLTLAALGVSVPLGELYEDVAPLDEVP